MNETVLEWLREWGLESETISWFYWVLAMTGIAVVVYAAHVLCTYVITPVVRRITRETRVAWDDILLNDTMLADITRLTSPIIIAVLLPMAFAKGNPVLEFLLRVNMIYVVVAVAKLLCSFLTSLYSLSNSSGKLGNHPLKGVYQMLKIVVICVAVIIIISILINKNPEYILTALGASAAVLMLVFKDMIMGLVAGVQLSANDMLRPGDWISMPKYGADGSVIEVTLTTVKVRNWDMTITTIPPYALVSDSFQNWRGMVDSGGRRIKRSIYIDMRSVTFASEAQLCEFERRGWMADLKSEDGAVVNLHVFRNYLENYLRHHPLVNKGKTIMVRQLQPTVQGLPIELYFFYDGTEWIPYEHAQAEILEHVFAILPVFGLRVFQSPMGVDFCGSNALQG